jgi:ParB family chromosome partitioning protein
MQQKRVPNPKGGPNIIRSVEVDLIKVPELRVTSSMDDHIMEELRESIQKEGILQPLQVARIGEDLIVEDGLHRLVVAKELGMKKVPCIIHEATERDLMIRNLVLNRQRGKSNPVHEAQIISYLLNTEKLTLEEVSALCNLSPSWVSRLHKISYLPPQVLSLVEEGVLAVSSADHLTKLQDPQLQIQTARDAVSWKYTEEQVKVRVQELLQVRPEPQPGEITFDPSGKPTIIPLVCYLCHIEVTRGDGYIWICDEHRRLIDDFWRAYLAQQPAVPQPVVSSPAAKRILTADGWKDSQSSTV